MRYRPDKHTVLAGGFFTTEPPRKPLSGLVFKFVSANLDLEGRNDFGLVVFSGSNTTV